MRLTWGARRMAELDSFPPAPSSSSFGASWSTVASWFDALLRSSLLRSRSVTAPALDLSQAEIGDRFCSCSVHA